MDMLATLRRLIQEVNVARNLEQALAIIVERVKQIIGSDVCSVYLADASNEQYVLMATNGLQPRAVGKVRLDKGEGLIGLVARRAEPVNLDDAPAHSRYRFFPDTGEEKFHAFLGVPIIHHRDVVGVLVVQREPRGYFDETSETLLITVAAQLAGAIAHAEASGGISGMDDAQKPIDGHRALAGQPGAPGVIIGTARVMYPYANIHAIPDRSIENVTAELIAFNHAVGEVRKDIEAMAERMQDVLPPEERALFDVYTLMLESESFTGVTRDRIEAGNWAPGALRQTIEEHEHVFNQMEDDYLRERVEDIRDLGRRILAYLQQEAQAEPHFPERTVVVAEEVTAPMLAEVPPDRLVGVVSVRGSRTSHVAILARALGVPAVMGVTDLPVGGLDGVELIADGYSGRVYVSPNELIREEYEKLTSDEAALTEELQSLKGLPSETPGGEHIPLYVNTGLLSDLAPTQESGAEGIGLYRTEFPFMIRQRFPGEEEQCNIYRSVLESQ
ncbi:MAG TPA: GAF domain-containing protein, partial [Chromatiales bacterium]|nr:GAF domain-containing protein [Chromatiales bacterium]